MQETGRLAFSSHVVPVIKYWPELSFFKYTDEITSTCSRRTSQDEDQKVTHSLDRKLKSQYMVLKKKILVDGPTDG